MTTNDKKNIDQMAEGDNDKREGNDAQRTAVLCTTSAISFCCRCGEVLSGPFCPSCGARQCISCGD